MQGLGASGAAAAAASRNGQEKGRRSLQAGKAGSSKQVGRNLSRCV